jgi:hypothetical protein
MVITINGDDTEILKAKRPADTATGGYAGRRHMRPGDPSSGSNLSRCPLGGWRRVTT